MKKGNRKAENSKLEQERDAIKRLLMLLLLKCGASQGEIAMALQVDQSTVSRLFPKRKVKPFDFLKKKEER